MMRVLRLAVVMVIVLNLFSAPLVGASDQELIDDEWIAEYDETLDPEPLLLEDKTDEFEDDVVQEDVEDPPLILPSLVINRVLAGIPNRSSYEYIELYNPNAHDVTLESYRLTVSDQDLVLNGVVVANGYVLIAGTDVGLDTVHPDVRLGGNNKIVASGGTVQLIDNKDQIVDTVSWSSLGNQMLERRYDENGLPFLNDDVARDFLIRSTSISELPRSGGYTAYKTPVNTCKGVIISEIAANVADDQQFIELYNTTSKQVVLDGCQLQTNRSKTKSFVLNGSLGAKKYRAVHMNTTDLTLTKTTTGTVYLLSSDGLEETAAQKYEKLAKDTSWSWFGGNDWRQTFTVTPGKPNVWQEFLPCQDGYERNRDTGRCRKIPVPKELTPCKANQYRNPETNRCRNIASANTLKPCKPGQERNPATNRCRSTASASKALKPCKPGQERNPETNRCRKVRGGDIPGAAFAVQETPDGSTFAGWWALGGVGVLAAGYGAWEWRREMWSGIRKVGSFFISGK